MAGARGRHDVVAIGQLHGVDELIDRCTTVATGDEQIHIRELPGQSQHLVVVHVHDRDPEIDLTLQTLESVAQCSRRTIDLEACQFLGVDALGQFGRE